jgi:hypothetical protein
MKNFITSTFVEKKKTFTSYGEARNNIKYIYVDMLQGGDRAQCINFYCPNLTFLHGCRVFNSQYIKEGSNCSCKNHA